MCDIEFDGANDFECSTRRKARKPHSCIECGKRIEPGQHYTHTAAKYDGAISTNSTCLKCVRVAAAHEKAESSMGNNGAYYVGELLSLVTECAAEHDEYLPAFRAAWRGEERST